MSDKILTVVVPSYNMEALLPKCLGSLVVGDEELLQKLDVIVVNDGSSDRTSEIAHGYEQRYPGVFRVVDKPNGHYGSCINTALSRAKGEYVRILDADDYASPEEFSRYLRALDSSARGFDLVLNDYRVVDPSGRVVRDVGLELGDGGEVDFDAMGRSGHFIGIHAIAYRTALFAGKGYRQTEGVMYSDTEWFSIPMLWVRRICYVPVFAFNYLVGREGQSMQMEICQKNRWMVERCLLHIASELHRFEEQAEGGAMRYVEGLALKSLGGVYSDLLNPKSERGRAQTIEEFDRSLKEANPKLYAATAEFLAPTSRFRFHYVEAWRIRHSRRQWRFLLFDLYRITLKLLRRSKSGDR